MAVNTASTTKLHTVGPFLGIDNTTVPTQVPPNHAVDAGNVVPDRVYETYCTVRGRSIFQGASPSPSLFGNIFKNIAGATTNYLAFGLDGSLYAFNMIANPVTITTGGVGTIPGSFTAYHQWVFFTSADGQSTVQINASLVTSFSNWGIAAPATAPTATAQAGGTNLTGQYQYVITFGNATVESSPSPLSNTVTPNAQEVALTAIPVSSDPQVTLRNIYRVGGTLADFLLVGTINDNTTTTFTDNLKDTKVTGQNLVPHRDPALPFTDITTWQDRVWGLGNNKTGAAFPNDVYYSNFAEPWGFDTTNQVIPVGRNNSGDNIVGGVGLGPILVVMKRKSTWAIVGDDQSNFLAQPLFNVGCTSKMTIRSAYGLCFWLSDQGVWQFDGANLSNISDGLNGTGSSIKTVLDSYSVNDLAKATSFIYDRFYCISFPTQGVTWMYFLPTQQWYKLSWATNSVCYDLDNANEVTAARVSMINGSWTNQSIVDSWFASEFDLGNPITSYYNSGQAGFDTTMQQKRYSHLELVAPIQMGSYATVTFIADPGPLQKTFTQTWNLGRGPLRRLISMPPNMLGFFSQVQVSVTSQAETQITAVNVYGYPKRTMVQKG